MEPSKLLLQFRQKRRDVVELPSAEFCRYRDIGTGSSVGSTALSGRYGIDGRLIFVDVTEPGARPVNVADHHGGEITGDLQPVLVVSEINEAYAAVGIEGDELR